MFDTDNPCFNVNNGELGVGEDEDGDLFLFINGEEESINVAQFYDRSSALAFSNKFYGIFKTNLTVEE